MGFGFEREFDYVGVWVWISGWFTELAGCPGYDFEFGLAASSGFGLGLVNKKCVIIQCTY